MEEFKDYVNKAIGRRVVDFNKCNIKDIKMSKKKLLTKIKEVIK